MTTERFETLEGGAHIVAGVEPDDIYESVKMATEQGWVGRYELEEDFSPAAVVVNCIRSRMQSFM
jgi:hypothetical protein